MQRLIKAGLFGEGLVAVDTPELAARYNRVLRSLGIAPTSLGTFRIDGMGWSPEIADEKDSLLYLSAGIANPYAVILTPDQYQRPIYFPFSSYDRALMQAYFDRHRGEIADITTTAGIGLDIDQELTRYQSPRDLLLVDYVVVRSFVDQLTEAARRQRQIVETITNTHLGWFDAAQRSALIESAKEHGDLRFRRIDIPDMKFSLAKTFYSSAFGGVFVLRPPGVGRGFLVLENDDYLQREDSKASDVYSIHDPRLAERLLQDRLAAIDLSFYRAHPELLSEKKEYVAVDALIEHRPELEVAELNRVQRKSCIAALGDRVPPLYYEIERLQKQLSGSDAPDMRGVSADLRLLLLGPAAKLSHMEQAAVWQLLCRLRPSSVPRLFQSDKNYFYQLYQSWPEKKRNWAVKKLQDANNPPASS